MVHELVQLIERAFVQQHVNTFAAVMRPEACCFSILSTPPPSEARLSSSSNWRYISSVHICIYNLVIYNIRTECDSGLFLLYQLQFNQYLVGIYRFALAHEDVADDAVGIYLIVTLHLRLVSSTTAMSPAASRSPTFDGDAHYLARHRRQNLVALLSSWLLSSCADTSACVSTMSVEGTLEHADVITLAASPRTRSALNEFVVQDGATSVLCHHNVHFVGLSSMVS